MTTLVSIRISEELLQAMRHHARYLDLSQTDYIRKAIENLNAEAGRQERESRLKNASLRVRSESMKINAEFSGVERDPEV